MNKIVKYGKEVIEGDQVVVYKYAGERLDSPKVVTVQAIKGTFFTTNYQFDRSIFSNLIERGVRDHVFRPLVRKGDKLHVFKFNFEESAQGKVVTALEDESVDEPVIVVDPPISFSGVTDNLLDLRDVGFDEWYFYSEEAEDYPVEWYEDPVKEERTSWIANEGGEEASVAIDIAGNISDSYNDCESSDVVYYTPSDGEEEYTPMSYSDFNAAHGGGKTLKDYTGVDITEDSLAFESALEKTLKGITPESLAFEESVDTSKGDMVEHPPHYNKYEREVIDSIRGLCTPDEFRGYLKGNIIKYVARYSDKDGVRDIDKLAQYTQFLREFEVEMGNE